ncbi:MAG TPA: ParB/RepB/Spo0J family partition protein [Bacillota bacterium]|nr:ParB/RepB/Spo0J family partition protein [Clostridiales bacterium]HPT85171.1 ParB/RepB/Spo0J family partition protein [Bacillota bacterium]
MSKPKTTGLGRGLDAIFGENSPPAKSDGVIMMRVSDIEPRPGQPRKDFDQDAMAQLAESIATHGLIQPVVVRPEENGFYQIVAGERRWRASKMAGLTEIPVVIVDADDRKAAELALIENIQREDLNPIEEAEAYRALVEEHNMTQEEISKQVSKSRSAIANALRLLELPVDVIEMVRKNELSAGHARALLGLRDPAKISELARAAVAKGMSVRVLEQTVRAINSAGSEAKEKAEKEQKTSVKVDYIRALQNKMTSVLGRKVRIHSSGKNKKIEIHYSDNDDLSQIIKLLCGENIFDEI